MKKLITIVITFALVLALAGCGGSGGNAATDSDGINITKMTAEEIIGYFVDGGFPIDNIVVYTEENDPNELLGRPNQYTSKINFADMRIDQVDDSSPKGGSIEVFGSSKDAKARKEYIDSIGESASLFAEYSYQYENVLLRIDKSLTPKQAAVYEEAFGVLADGADLAGETYSFDAPEEDAPATETEEPQEEEQADSPAAVAETPAETPKQPAEDAETRNCRAKANEYLDYTAFSKPGLVEQLVYEGFDETMAQGVVDSLDVDWENQCALKAKDYLEFSSFSESGLRDQLAYEGFTPGEIDYAIEVAYR
jgi:hypothetical protein